MLLLASLAAAAVAGPVDEPDVLLVTTPGLRLEAYEPLLAALRAGGSEVVPVGFPCSGDLGDLVDVVRRADDDLDAGYVVVAHGLGATLALLAHDGLDPDRFVLLAPVLDLWPVAATRWLAEQPIGERVDLGAPLAWPGLASGEGSVQELLLGAEAPLGCVSPRLAAELQGWIRAGEVPLPLEAVEEPVWIGIGLMDQVATVEAIVPASRRLPRRELVRLGITRLDPRDYGHLDLLVDPVPVRAAAAAVRGAEDPADTEGAP